MSGRPAATALEGRERRRYPRIREASIAWRLSYEHRRRASRGTADLPRRGLPTMASRLAPFCVAIALALASTARAQTVRIGGRVVNAPPARTTQGFSQLGTACSVIRQCAVANPGPGDTAWDGTFLWQGNYFGNAVIEQIDPTTCAVVHSIPAPGFGGVGGLAWDGSTLWACDEQAGQIFRLDPTNGNVLSVIPAPGFGQLDPNSAGLAWDGQYLWHADYTTARIYKLDPANGNILADFPTPGPVPGGVGYHNGVVLVADAIDGHLYQLDANTGALLSSCVLPGTHPWGVEVASDGSTWNADGFTDTLYDIDTGFSVQPIVYCTAGTSTHGCTASIAANDNPSVTHANACNISIGNVEGQKFGIVFYGINQMTFTPTPWANGSTSFLCVKGPTQRTGTANSGGTLNTCGGALALDWNAYQTANPNALGNPWTVGHKVYVQAWYRDPPAPKTTNLSNAVQLTYIP
jgi:hypothetical protein